MGLFGRGRERDARIEVLTAEISSLRQRLDESETARAGLTQRLTEVDSTSRRVAAAVGTLSSAVDGIDDRVSSVDHRMTDFDIRVVGAGETAAALSSALDALGERHDKVETRVDEVGDAVDEQRRHLEDVVLVTADTARVVGELDGAGSHLPASNHEADLVELRSQIGKIAERLSALDTRVDQVSTELVNQLGELGRDIDELHRRAADDAATAGSDRPDDESTQAIVDLVEERLAEIIDGQRRLASEQTRYEIQFREDLAELAERLRRPTR